MRRVQEKSLQLAERLDVRDDSQLQALKAAGLLHDVGKIGIPDSILLKLGKLTSEEFEVVKTHTVIGARILSGSKFPIMRLAEEIAFSHHERWDGGGYPDGLAGEDIPVEARIIAVADAFSAMTADRPYRKPMTVSEACAELERCATSQFDPLCVRHILD